MSLPSPLSVGDAILLAQIAYNVAQAFTSGANSAPAEFAEVQNLLYSVSESLKLLARVLAQYPAEEIKGDPLNLASVSTSDDETYIVLANILTNCRGVLKYLEEFVAKYSILGSNENSGKKGERRLKDEIKRNWKKVAWTKEGGDIVKLKQTLTAHTNALNLAVTVMNGGQQTATQRQVETIHNKLDEIYQWFVLNLKRQETESTTLAEPLMETGSASTDTKDFNFVLYEEQASSSGLQRVLICPHTTLETDVVNPNNNFLSQPSRPIFKCLCSSLPGWKGGMGPENHVNKLTYRLLPVSLLVKMAGPSSKGSWQICVHSPLSNTIVSLLLTEIQPIYLAKLESWANRLAMFQAANHMANNLNTALVLRTPDTVSTLNVKSNTAHLGGYLLSVRFSANGAVFTAQQPSSVQLLHYATVPMDFWDPGLTYETASGGFAPRSHANVLVACKPSLSSFHQTSEEEQRYIIEMHYDTIVSSFKGARFVILQTVPCVRETNEPPSDPEPIKCSEVEFEFSDASAANEFLENLNHMKQRLLLQYLQQARWGERIIYQRGICDLMIQNILLNNAQLSIILDPLTGRYRMILLRDDHSASVCFELPPDFLDEIDSGTSKIGRNCVAWFVEVGTDGVSIVKQRSGIDPLSPLRNDLHKALRSS